MAWEMYSELTLLTDVKCVGEVFVEEAVLRIVVWLGADSCTPIAFVPESFQVFLVELYGHYSSCVLLWLKGGVGQLVSDSSGLCQCTPLIIFKHSVY